jgi:hypothetical protein
MLTLVWEGEMASRITTAINGEVTATGRKGSRDEDSEIPRQVQKLRHPLQGGNYRTILTGDKCYQHKTCTYKS